MNGTGGSARLRETSKAMKKAISAAIVTAALLAAPTTGAQTPVVSPRLPAALAWSSPPGNAAVRGAWLLGSESEAAPYVFRVELARGARLPVHTHNDTRVTTVLSGTLYVGFGERFDAASLVAVPSGAVYVAPAGVPHFLAAIDGEVAYQENGFGPTSTMPYQP